LGAAIVLGSFFVGLLLRNSAPVRRLRSAQYSKEVIVEINERVLKDVMDICTPLFLGFAVPYAFASVKITTVRELLLITGLIVYIIGWLHAQRLFFPFLKRQLKSFDLWKIFLHDFRNFVGLLSLYFG
jgi:hypothetical protein